MLNLNMDCANRRFVLVYKLKIQSAVIEIVKKIDY